MAFDTEERCKQYIQTDSKIKTCKRRNDGKWGWSWTVNPGDVCDCNDNQRADVCKYMLVSSTYMACAVSECKHGYTKQARSGGSHMAICRKTSTITCDASKGEVLSIFGDSCDKCQRGYIAKDGKCEQCPFDKKPNGNKCIDYSCGPSEYKAWGDCKKCPENHIVENNKCVNCPSQKAENNKCVDFNCSAIDEIKSHGKCVKCSRKNQIANSEHTNCVNNKTETTLKEFARACTNVGGTPSGDICRLSADDISDAAERCVKIEEDVGMYVSIDSSKNSVECYIPD